MAAIVRKVTVRSLLYTHRTHRPLSIALLQPLSDEKQSCTDIKHTLLFRFWQAEQACPITGLLVVGSFGSCFSPDFPREIDRSLSIRDCSME